MIQYILFSTLLLARAQIPYSIGSSEFSALRKLCTDHLKTPTTLRDTYYSTRVLSTLNLTDYKCSCSSISKLLVSAKSGFDHFYGIASGSACGCNVELSSVAKNAIKADLKSSELHELAGAALAAKASGEKIASMKDVVGKIKSLMEPDGTFKASADGSSSIENTRLAMEVLTLYSDSSSKFLISEIVETVAKLLPSGDDDNTVDPLLLGMLSTLSADSKIRLSAAQVNSISYSLLQLFHSHDLATVAQSIASLSVIKTYSTQPLHIALSKTTFDVQATEKSLSVEVRDVFGSFVEPTSVEIKSVKKTLGSKESSVFSGKLDVDGSKAKLDLSGATLTPGLYAVRVAVIAPGRKSTISVEKFITITADIQISSVWAGVADGKQTQLSDLSPIKKQNTLSGYTASSAAADYIHVAFTLSASKEPHQVFLKFTHIETNTYTYFVGQDEGSSGSFDSIKYRFAVSLADEIETFLYHSGEYTMSILVGDVALPAMEWVVGELGITLASKPKKDYPLYARSLLHTSDQTMESLPEITHKMRGPPKKASLFMSSFFTVLTASPLAFLVIFLLTLKPNVNRLRSIWSVLFVVCIGGALALYAAYWLALPGASFYDTIKYICLLVPATFIVGRSALASVSYLRAKDNKKEF